ncbi:MAG: hypothetical protein ACYDDA_00680 [Acidiferrobacteraceae bacterium]
MTGDRKQCLETSASEYITKPADVTRTLPATPGYSGKQRMIA